MTLGLPIGARQCDGFAGSLREYLTPIRLSAADDRHNFPEVVVRNGLQNRNVPEVVAEASEAELTQLLRVALPVLGDPHVQIEVDAGAQQLLDLAARLA